jgi:hypothetical protein
MSHLAEIEMSHRCPVQLLDSRHSDGNSSGNYHHVDARSRSPQDHPGRGGSDDARRSGRAQRLGLSRWLARASGPAVQDEGVASLVLRKRGQLNRPLRTSKPRGPALSSTATLRRLQRQGQHLSVDPRFD